MFKKAEPIFIFAETPTRVGSGSELGYVDLPIQRERHSGFPKIEASSLKGSIRSVFESDDNLNKMINYTFGPEDGNLHAGGLGFIDGRILLFPVKSAKGIFAWITCPYILSRFKEEMMLCKKTGLESLEGIEKIKPNSIANDSNLALMEDEGKGVVMLEEYKFEVSNNKILTQFSKWISNVMFPEDQVYQIFKDKMKKDIMVISDDAFRDFTELSTEVITRTKIDETKGIVKRGHLFNEEYVPENTVFYSLALASSLYGMTEKEKEEKYGSNKLDEDIIMAYFLDGINNHKIIQIGSNATIGKGLIRVCTMKGES